MTVGSARLVQGWRPALPSQVADAALLGAAALTAAALTLVLGTYSLALPVAAAGAILLMRYPPVLLAAAVFIPTFKSLPVIASLPFDPTLALSALLAVVCGYRALNGRARVPPPLTFTLPMVFIAVALVIGLMWTPEPAYGQQKVIKFVTVTALAAVAPFFVIEDRRDFLMLCLSIAAAAVVVAILAPVVHPTVASGIATELDTKGRYSFGGQIFPARFLCDGAVVLLLAPNYATGRWRLLAPWVGVGVMIIAVGFGSRGPIAAFVLTVVVIAILSAVQSRRVLAAWLAGAILLAALVSVFQVPGVASQRLTALATNPAAAITRDPRYPLYRQAVILIGQHPLTGLGTGGYALYANALSPRNQILMFPHNIFLELGSELGVIPPLVLLLTVIAAFVQLLSRIRAWHGNRGSQLFVLTFALLLYNVLASQFSGDINDNRAFWLFLGVAVLLAKYPRTVLRKP